MDISSYIKDLLYRYECVIMPGFGAFLTQYHPAVIKAETGYFYPPSKTLSFNRQLQTNDGLLANYVATVENCSYEIALQKLRNLTGQMSLHLAEGKDITLSGLGSFILNEEKSILFSPLVDQNFNTTAFGLNSFILPKVKREVYKETVQVLEEKVPIYFSPEKRNAVPYLKYAAVALIALTIGGLGGMKIYEREVQKQNFASRIKATQMLESKIQEATFVIESPLTAMHLIVPKEIGIYHIIAGAYREAANADKKMGQLKEKGYFPQLMGTNKYGLHQVIYASFSNRKEALNRLYEIKRNDNPDAWLLVKKLD